MRNTRKLQKDVKRSWRRTGREMEILSRKNGVSQENS
jgi:hypothetical protein